MVQGGSMKLTKYQHACFTVEEDGKLLVVDPGEFSTDFLAPENVVGIVITHQHPDHFDQARIAEIMDKNPDAIIIGPQSVTSQIEAFASKTVSAGETLVVAPFNLVFHGGQHALIHQDIPVIENIGVLINDLIYYPGDSFVLPSHAVDTLLLPASAPWMRMSDAMNFLAALRPRQAIPTHDAILSNEGKAIADRLLGDVASNNTIEYTRPTSPLII